MVQIEAIEADILYDKQGKMLYHPEFHENQGKGMTTEDLEYLCYFYTIDHTRSLSFALGRTERSLMTKVAELRKAGQFDRYRQQYIRKIFGGERK